MNWMGLNISIKKQWMKNFELIQKGGEEYFEWLSKGKVHRQRITEDQNEQG